jgi:hypothetical protein
VPFFTTHPLNLEDTPETRPILPSLDKKKLKNVNHSYETRKIFWRAALICLLQEVRVYQTVNDKRIYSMEF